MDCVRILSVVGSNPIVAATNHGLVPNSAGQENPYMYTGREVIKTMPTCSDMHKAIATCTEMSI